jgi:hypothetical protein
MSKLGIIVNHRNRPSEAIPSFGPPQVEQSSFIIPGKAGWEVCH